MRPHYFFDPATFTAELIFTIIAVIFCFLIFFKTREIYNLTKYKGIKYFRDAFLFLGMSYVIRFLFSLILFSTFAFDFLIPKKMFMALSIFPLGYFSTMGIFYMVLSLVWKSVNNKKILFIGHAIAILLSIIAFITRSHFILLYLQCFLIMVIFVLIFAKKELGHISQIKVMYLLISTLWLINLFIVDRIRPFPFEIEVTFQMISLAVFITVYCKITKWLK